LKKEVRLKELIVFLLGGKKRKVKERSGRNLGDGYNEEEQGLPPNPPTGIVH